MVWIQVKVTGKHSHAIFFKCALYADIGCTEYFAGNDLDLYRWETPNNLFVSNQQTLIYREFQNLYRKISKILDFDLNSFFFNAIFVFFDTMTKYTTIQPLNNDLQNLL